MAAKKGVCNNPPDPRVIQTAFMIQVDKRKIIPVAIPHDYRAETFRAALWRHLPKVYRFSISERTIYVRLKTP